MSKQGIGMAALAALTLRMGAGIGGLGMGGGGRRTHGGGTNQSPDAIDFEPLTLEGDELTAWHEQVNRERIRGTITSSQKRKLKRGDTATIADMRRKYAVKLAHHEITFEWLFADLLGDQR